MSEDPKNVTKSSEAPKWAAEEPTAMWDEGALAEKGFDSSVQTASPGATRPDVGGADPSKVHVQRAPGSSPGTPPGGLSWPLTIGIATVVAVIVYLAVRMLR